LQSFITVAITAFPSIKGLTIFFRAARGHFPLEKSLYLSFPL
jgi:hypothetical protein